MRKKTDKPERFIGLSSLSGFSSFTSRMEDRRSKIDSVINVQTMCARQAGKDDTERVPGQVHVPV